MAAHVPSNLCSTPLLARPPRSPISALKPEAARVRNLADLPLSKWNDYFPKAEVRIKLNRMPLNRKLHFSGCRSTGSAVSADAAQVRSLADFPLSQWNGYFTKFPVNGVDLSREWHQIEGLKAEVRIKLSLLADKPLPQLIMIDAIQLLGLGYQFQEEIDLAMKTMFETNPDIGGYDLYHTSLYFRLLRQYGYNVSSSVFKKFIDISGRGALKEDFQCDVLGMLSFYEAAQLRINADAAILDEETLAKCTAHLESMSANLSPRLKAQVTHALEQSIHKDIPWLRARKHIETYQEDESHDKTLLALAKLHFNVLQKQHQQELCDISKRWTELDIASKFPYARDRVVESYFWALAVYYEPQYHLGRKIFTKIIALLTIADDTYDAYGTAEELPLLTESISRGDTSMFEQLPDYATAFCQIILDFYVEIEQELVAEGRAYCTPYLIQWTKNAVRNYYDEYLWLKKKNIPTMEEYRRVAFASANLPTAVMYLLAGLANNEVTKGAFDWISREPEMIVASQIIGRFQDDIVSFEFEQKREHVPSAVQCYMKQYKVSKEEACKELSKEVSDAWKVLNEGCLKPTAFPFPVTERILNFNRLGNVMYRNGDSLTFPAIFMEDKLTSLLVDPVAT